MCGIFGLLTAKGVPDKDWFANMAKTQQHRGPDGMGVYVDSVNGIGLAHNRLAILDLTTNGSQPIFSMCENYVMVFNGEIYNFIDIKKQILKKFPGVIFKGSSDSEVFVNCFSCFGVQKTLQMINGMFSIALWDRENKTLMLARDRFGEKPLYAGFIDGCFVFSSELKPIINGFNVKVCGSAISQMLMFGYIPQPLSVFRHIYKLKPGCFVQVSVLDFDKISDVNEFVGLQTEFFSYFSLGREERWKGVFEGGERAVISTFNDLLGKSVAQCMVADVNVGASLSGGVDPSLIVSLMQQHSKSPVNTFSIGFDDAAYNECIFARKIARHLGCNHTEAIFNSFDIAEFVKQLPIIFDEPFADSSQLPTLLLSKHLKNQVTVGISGDGADGLLGGYTRYLVVQEVWKFVRFFSSLSKQVSVFANENLMVSKFKLWRFLKRAAAPKFEDFYMAFCAANPAPDVFTAPCKKLWNCFLYEIPKTLALFNKMQFLDVIYYLPDDILVKVDRCSMHFGLEMRAPYLDLSVASFSAEMPMSYRYINNEQKWVCKELLSRYVPRELFQRPKSGFAIPMHSYLANELRDWSSHLLSLPVLESIEGLNVNQIIKCYKSNLSGRQENTNALWNVLMLVAWMEEWKL